MQRNHFREGKTLLAAPRWKIPRTSTMALLFSKQPHKLAQTLGAKVHVCQTTCRCFREHVRHLFPRDVTLSRLHLEVLTLFILWGDRWGWKKVSKHQLGGEDYNGGPNPSRSLVVYHNDNQAWNATKYALGCSKTSTWD